MASVKLYLDARSPKKDGTFPLKLTITHQKPFHISLDVSIPKENWIENKIEGKIKNKKFLNTHIQARLSSVENYLLTLKLQEKLDKLTPQELKKQIDRLNNPDGFEEEKEEKILGESLLFGEYAEKFISTRKTEGTKDVYKYTLNAISKLYDLSSLTSGDINYNWLEEFETSLCSSTSTNTRGIHLRNIRAIFKNANKKKVVSKDLYPFEDYSIEKEETAHRNLTIENLRTLKNYPVEPHQEKYRDLFMLLFYMIGINMVDILHATGIHNGRLQYRRAKTGKLYDIKIHPEAMLIIKKYSPGKKYLLNFLDNYQDYRDFRKRFNMNLQQIGLSEWIITKSKNGRVIKKKSYKPLFPFLSSYYARHTWASIAAYLDIPEKTIKMALGHGAKTTTDIYINFDIKKVDEANKKVINYLFEKEDNY